MIIKRLKLFNFRNHKKIELGFAQTNLLFGSNGVGKTSILEALCLLSTSKSPRTTKIRDLISYKGRKSLIELELIDNNKNTKIIRLLLDLKSLKNKTFSLDGVAVEPKGIIGFLKTVYFSPETLEIINGSPSERRRFVDILISQIDKNYLSDLIEYKKILISRNHLLKLIFQNKRERDEIIFWDNKLIEYGSRIMQSRQNTIKQLSPYLNKYHRRIINGKKTEVKIIYHPSFSYEGKEKNIADIFTERLVVEKDFEMRYGSTIFGPHRDDIRFVYNGHDVTSFCSRGEIRTIVVALKIAEAKYLKLRTKDKPLILLDDIYSELDSQRASALNKMIASDYQTIISSTEETIAQNFIKTKRNLIKLDKEQVYV